MAAPSGNGERPFPRGSEAIDGLRLRPLPAVSEPSFPLAHEYFEIVYAPLLGPTAVLVARAMVRHLDAAGGPATVCPVELALEVGIRASSTDPLGRKSHLVHAIDRLVHDHVVVRQGDRVLGVRFAVPLLSTHGLQKLPASARLAHSEFARTIGFASDGS